MIQIKTSELKTFLSRASAIKTDTIIPVSSYLRIKGESDKTSMYKAGQHSFIVHEIDSENEETFDFLIEEKSLSIAIEGTDSETVYFEPADGIVKITVGNYEQTSAGEDVNIFYKFPEFDNAFECELSGEVLNAINSASKYAHAGKEFISNLSFVHVNNNSVCATDNKKSYYRKFDENLPVLVLRLDTCSVLSKFGNVKAKTIDTHYLFSTGSSIYGFAKEAYEAPNFEKAFNTIQEIKRPGFTVNKDSVFTFADKSHKLSGGYVDAIEIMDMPASKVKFGFKSDTVKASTFTEIIVDKKEGYEESVSFLVSAAALKVVLSSMSSEAIDVCRASHGASNFLIFSEDANQISFIMGMSL